MEAALVTPLDIRYLLLLQTFREQIHDRLTPLMESVSLFSITYLIVLPILVYWMIDKKSGLYTLASYSLCYGINAIVKLTVCAYRPWIRDPRIRPAGVSIRTAGGYSFPSGHTSTAGPIYGGLAVSARKRWKWLSAFGVFMILFTGFSRNYLGVHTPQDVLVGVVAGTLVMYLTMKLMQWIKKHPEKDLLVVCIGVGLAILVAIYAAVKPYPTDTDAAGKVLVEGAKMANDTFKGVGWSVAFLTGWILERRFVQFSTDIFMMNRITRLTFGLLSYYVVSLIFVPVIKDWISGVPGTFVTCYLQMLYVSFIFPWILKHVEKTGRISNV